jgi:hypothetical protein
MKNRFTVFTLTAFMMILLFSCNYEQSKPPNLYTNDFDNYLDWGFTHELLVKGGAHSGNYCCKTDGNSQFGLGMKLRSEEFKDMKPRYMVVSAWVKSEKSNPKSSIVATFDEGKTNVSWNGIDLSKEINQNNKWIFVTKRFDFPKNLYPGVDFSFFLWNTGGVTVWIDDMSVEFIK